LKKHQETHQDPKRKPRRLTLSRETIQSLDDSAFLELASGRGPIVTTSIGVPFYTTCL